MHTLARLTQALSAAGEPSRLRLIALCALRERTVSELANAMEHSEARVSRHLRILAEAGLVRRRRRGQWVYYGIDGALATMILAQLDPADVVRRRDEERVRRLAREVCTAMPAATRAGRAVGAFVAEGASRESGAHEPAAVRQSVTRLLLIEPRELELLETATALARHTVVVAREPRVREALREHAERAGLALTLRSSVPSPGARAETFDAALLDLTSERGADALAPALAAMRAQLAPAARAWVVLSYDAFEPARGNVVAHPIALLRAALRDAGFSIERVKPIESGTEPLLVAQATRATAAEHAA
jgi:DNA-binding transcriptional ArsR family regulator